MPAEINYKSKYMEIRAKYMNDLDMAFRCGFEQGQQQAQQDQIAQEQAQQQEAEAQMMNAAAGSGGEQSGAQPGQPGAEEEQNPMSENPAGSELDQHIAKLESMLGSSKDPAIQKSLSELVSFRKAELQAIQLKKSEQAIKAISKNLHKPKFKMSQQAAHNLNSNAKQAVSMQHKIVTDVLDKMEKEEQKTSKDIQNILNVENLIAKG